MQYTGESMNPDGMVALLNYRVSPSSLLGYRIHTSFLNKADGITRKFHPIFIFDDIHPAIPAYITFWKDGLKETKL